MSKDTRLCPTRVRNAQKVDLTMPRPAATAASVHSAQGSTDWAKVGHQPSGTKEPETDDKPRARTCQSRR